MELDHVRSEQYDEKLAKIQQKMDELMKLENAAKAGNVDMADELKKVTDIVTRPI
jgi:hypothetical protein